MIKLTFCLRRLHRFPAVIVLIIESACLASVASAQLRPAWLSA